MSDTHRDTALLRIEDLRVHFLGEAGTVRAVDGVSYTIARGETLAVVGESGCGKSVTAMSILGLVPRPPAHIPTGRILFDGEDMVTASPERLRELRGNDAAMIFQEPLTSLNPVYTVGDQIGEAVELHRGASPEAARARAIALLERVGMPAPEQRIDEYPHQLSGGMCQRVMIAMALACDPKLLIADEPTTALDVTVQAQILDLLRELQRDTDMAVLLITHDLGVVAEMAHRVVVMYAGEVVERAPVRELFARPRHPYTAGLLRSIPRPTVERAERLATIEGSVPDALSFPNGCKFHPRCPFAMQRCAEEAPPEHDRSSGTPGAGAAAGAANDDPSAHRSACWVVDEQPEIDLMQAPLRPIGNHTRVLGAPVGGAS